MKHLKMLGLLAVTAAALMAFAGTASATVLTSPEGTTYTGEIVATSANSEFDGAAVTVKCGHSEVKGKVENHGVGKNVSFNVSLWTLTECNYTMTVKNGGSMAINSSNNVISSGAEISMATSVGTCVLTTNGTPFGSVTEGKDATWDLNSAKIPRTGGNFLCGSSWTWTGSFDFTTPNDLWVD